MLNHSDLNRLYNLLLENKELTTKNLNEYGFNSKEINLLIEEGILRRIKRGYYTFLADDKLFSYGEKLLEEKEYKKADKCFEKCYELNSFNYGACTRVFLISIVNRNYELSFRCLESLFALEEPRYRSDANYYMYLLSMITNIPEKYIEYAKNICFEDVIVEPNDIRYENVELENEIRINSLKRKFVYAIKLSNDLFAQSESFDVLSKISKHLIVKASNVQKVSKSKLLVLLKKSRYNDMVTFYEKEQLMHNLSIADNYVLKVLKQIIEIKKTGKIPEKVNSKEINTTLDAIDCNDYELAFELCEKFNEENNINSTESIISILLSDIMDLIYEISLDKKTKDKEINKLIQKEEKLEEEENVKFADILSYLLNYELDNAFSALSSYMKCINKKEYEFLVVSLIKLGLVKNDAAYMDAMMVLTNITKNNFNFDVSIYVQEFYLSLSQNKFEEAKIYLDIISNSEEYKNNNNFISNLSRALNNAFQEKQNNIIVKKYEEKVDYSEDKNDFITQNKKAAIPLKQETPIKATYEPRDSEKEFIEAKCDKLLKEKGAILLKPMNSERRKKIHEIIKNHPNIVSFSIGEEKERRVVLRYVEKQTEYIDYKELTRKSCELNRRGKYDESIAICLQLLQYGNPNAILYSNLGIAYMKKFELDIAVDYLTIATYMSNCKKGTGKFNYTELIQRLKSAIDPECDKPDFKMNASEFKSDLDNYYGINNIAEITEYIIKTKVDVESACLHFGMNKIQTDIIYLIYAREYYSQSLYDKGDEFLREFERSKNKTDSTIKIYDEIRKNRKFYFNREKNKSYCLTLTMQPKKR